MRTKQQDNKKTLEQKELFLCYYVVLLFCPNVILIPNERG